jgi:gamma-glutamyltranspeptidase/glutathione hydrolase
LNNQLTDFAFEPGQANSVAPGKRPRSSMSPTLVFDRDNRLVMVVGSPGGARIIPFVIQALIGVLDEHRPVQDVISAPRLVNMNTSHTELESGRFPPETMAFLKARGHRVLEMPLTSGLNSVTRAGDGTLTGGTDPRREGLADGE